MPLEHLVTQRADVVWFQASAWLTGQLVVSLGGGQKLILTFASAVGGIEAVAAHSGYTGAFRQSALLDQRKAAVGGTSERVRCVAGTSHGFLNYQFNDCEYIGNH